MTLNFTSSFVICVFCTLGVAYFALDSTLPGSHELSNRERVKGFQKEYPAGRNFSRKCIPYRKRLREYCHNSLLEPKHMEITQEGQLVKPYHDFETLDLVHAHVVIRHGDRTPALAKVSIGHPSVNYKCGVGGIVHRSETWGAHRPNLWEGLRDFPPLYPVGSDNIRNGGLRLHPGPVNTTCGVGDLTARGLLQLHNLGTLLQMSYGQLFPGMDMTTDIHVQSTDFRRTIRSAGAFLLGFVPNDAKIREMVKIHVEPGSVNQAPPDGIPLTYNPCRMLRKLRDAENEKRGYYAREKYFHWMYDKVVKFFNLSVTPYIQWTDLFDQFLTRGCHAFDSHSVLPCTKEGACIDCRLGKGMFDYADWSITSKYPSNASLVAATPFLKHLLLEPIEKIIAGGQPSLKYRIMLTFTHDSMLNWLFKALGLPLKEWAPYASRLSFELWKGTPFLEAPKYFLRVLLNGKVVTHEFPFSDNDEESNEIVDFADFKKNIVPVNQWAYNKLCGI